MSPRAWLRCCSLALGIGLLQLLAALNPAIAELDPEELYNAGHAWQLADGHLQALFRLQYREFCGGCTLDAALAAPLFAVLPRIWLVWKLVPVGYTVLLALVGIQALHRRVGAAAALAFALLLAFPPRAFLHLSLIGWGNHYEAGVVGTLGLIAATSGRRSAPLLGGALLGLALWISFSGAFALVGTLGLLLFQRRPREASLLLLGLLLGLLPWVGQILSTGQHPFVTIYQEGETAPTLSRIPYKLWTLLAPRQLVALFGHPSPPFGWIAGWLWTGSAGLLIAMGIRRGPPIGRAALALCITWVGIYALVRFQLWDPPWPEIAGPGSVRYAAALYPPLLLGLAAILGQAWNRRARFAGLLGALLLIPGLVARAETFLPPFPTLVLARREAVEWEHFRPQFSYSLNHEEHLDMEGEGSRSRELHAYAIGRNDAAALLQGESRDLGALAPAPDLDPQAWGEGIGAALSADLDDRHPPGLPVLIAAAGQLDRKELAAAVEQAALRQVAWEQVRTEGSWLTPGVALDEGALQVALGWLEGEAPPVRQAATWALGRFWAESQAALALPSRLQVPAVDLPPAFWEGLGHGAGLSWGPQDELPQPSGSLHEAAFLRGYISGVEAAWLGSAEEPSPQLSD